MVPVSESHHSSAVQLLCAAQGLVRWILQHHIAVRYGHARQHAALGFFLGAQARPFDRVMHAARNQLADARAAGAIAAGTGPVQATLLHGVEQRLIGPGIALLVAGSEAGGEEWRGKFRRHESAEIEHPKAQTLHCGGARLGRSGCREINRC